MGFTVLIGFVQTFIGYLFCPGFTVFTPGAGGKNNELWFLLPGSSHPG